MADDADLLLLIILVWANFRTAGSENCALAANADKPIEPPIMAANARRKYTDLVNPEIKYKFGITYPPGVSGHEGYTTIKYGVTKRFNAPPTNFFPKGSSRVTVTLEPWPLVYVNHHSLVYHCDFAIRPCMRVYNTGPVCAHALHGTSWKFSNYCAMEHANCLLKTNAWQVAYFGECNVERLPDTGQEFDVEGDNFLESAIINLPPFDPLTGEEVTVFK